MNNQIVRDRQIRKFSYYGFFKNLKFFEPYFFIYLLSHDYNLFYIGIIFAVKKLTVYILEIPSGAFADNFGRKTAMIISFIAYMASFVLFFASSNLIVLIIGMILLGTGDAFRTGTHKAIIMDYLDRMQWSEHKTAVYGRTRSFSLIGSALSAFASIVFVLNIPALRWIFLLTLVPYVIDFLLILSYPGYLNTKRDRSRKVSVLGQIRESFREIADNRHLGIHITASSVFDGVFDILKDYIQPILQTMVIAGSVLIIGEFSADDSTLIILGILYGIFNLVSSFSSRNAYKLRSLTGTANLINSLFITGALIILVMSPVIVNNRILILIACFAILHIIKNIRRPLIIGYLGDHMRSENRATILSGESQLKAITAALWAPAAGFIAEYSGVGYVFLFTGIIFLLMGILTVFLQKRLPA
ncbi:MAG: MFS transporter [bacterium]